MSEPFNKVAGSRSANISKKNLVQVFLVSFAKFFIASFFKEDLRAIVSEDTENDKKF